MRKASLATAALTATALLALSACGGNSPDEGVEPVSAPTTAATTSAPAPATSSAAPTATASASASASASVKTITLDVKGGKVTGDTGIVDLKVNEPFQVVVTSDVADEVHVHTETRAGFSGDVEAGGTVTIDAVIKAASKYEVELEGRKLTLTRLAVT